jgi:ATP-binding cassette subfamily B protein
VLDKGEIAEIGTHDELIRKQGIYFGLVMAQRQMAKMDK